MYMRLSLEAPAEQLNPDQQLYSPSASFIEKSWYRADAHAQNNHKLLGLGSMSQALDTWGMTVRNAAASMAPASIVQTALD